MADGLHLALAQRPFSSTELSDEDKKLLAEICLKKEKCLLEIKVSFGCFDRCRRLDCHFAFVAI